MINQILHGFIYQVNYFESRENGERLSSAEVNMRISFKVNAEEVFVELDRVDGVPMYSKCQFQRLGRETDLLPDRVQFLNFEEKKDVHTPVACQIFYNENSVPCVRFVMGYPDQIVEFHGEMMMEESTLCDSPIWADDVVLELEKDGCLNVETLMEAGAKIYGEYGEKASDEAIAAVVEALKLFVMANKKDAEMNGKRASMYKPKILMFIALCNFKLRNYALAYCASKQGLDVLLQVAQNSVIKFPSSLLGKDTMLEVLELLKQRGFDDKEYKFAYNQLDVNVIDTGAIEDLFATADYEEEVNNRKASDREFLLPLIMNFDVLRNELMKEVFEEGDKEALASVYVLHQLACPAFFAWELYGHGSIMDFWKEEAVINAFEEFKQHALEIMKKQRLMFGTRVFPLESLDKDTNIKKQMLKLLDTLISDMEKR